MQLFLQFLKTGLVAGLLYGLFAYGLSLILSINKVFHVAQGATFVLSAYIYYTISTEMGLPMPVALLGSLISAGICGIVIQFLIYKPLAKRNADPMVILVASLLVVAFTKYSIELVWGNNVKSATIPAWFDWSTSIGGIRFDTYDVAVVLVSVAIFAGMHWFLNHTRPGLEFRAVGDNPERASALAIDLNKVFFRSMVLGSLLAAPAAFLVVSNGPIQASTGFDLLLKAVLALTIGGMGRMTGALIGGIFVGLAEALPPLWLPTEWAQFVLYAVAFAFVVFRPRGLTGGKRKPKTRTPAKASNGPDDADLSGQGVAAEEIPTLAKAAAPSQRGDSAVLNSTGPRGKEL